MRSAAIVTYAISSSAALEKSSTRSVTAVDPWTDQTPRCSVRRSGGCSSSNAVVRRDTPSWTSRSNDRPVVSVETGQNAFGVDCWTSTRTYSWNSRAASYTRVRGTAATSLTSVAVSPPSLDKATNVRAA